MPLTPVLSYTLWKDQNKVGGVGGRADTEYLLQKVVPWCGTLSFKSRSYVWWEAGDGGTQCPRYRYLAPLYCTIFATQTMHVVHVFCQELLFLVRSGGMAGHSTFPFNTVYFMSGVTLIIGLQDHNLSRKSIQNS